MDRRKFIKTASAISGLATLQSFPIFAFAADKVINVYSGSDSNIIDFWNNFIRPEFEKTHPE
ncbi:MAG: hypothetical protein CENE_01143 [Candidatus Celerinatantimonas neptuna]|nr:MAG: hypothetical protein CENE_01143 [Candidatus Celerinatantimonas neptuna]